ncbi:telomere repeats-binding bouquet formation protein 1 [Thalassophryne amazonica]|uniref:telomere repeats-binding bouquet formation protein 1 n=1 Tax=Thalassophryne amazonica TaxID=390379 RepID=UPI0014722249|nr:telomere repeats-binding bouquet formation protein 1 [Thalassophryne amazonica]
MEVGRISSRNTIRTDLSLLLECLKFQMKCPDMQKQALLTIHSICENREDNVDLLREMGGVMFVYNLSKSSIVHHDVKETALFTLGTLAEANVYCKNSLCRKEIFSNLAGCLTTEEILLTQKIVSVYLLTVLIANNKLGQTLAQTTGCLDVLMDLFRMTFPLSTDGTLKAANATQNYQLWASVSSALCGCVNNPQNEDGQNMCVAVFPVIRMWLQQIVLPRSEIFQPICSFIAMTVANNPCAQEGFSASGGLEALTLTLVHRAAEAATSLLSCQLSVTLSKTLSACITDNSVLASSLAQYGVVSQLFSLLASPNLDSEDRISVLLTLGHCTEASEEHQSQLLQCGGLPIIITLLTEDKTEEVRKAATFILQTCKQATMSLGVPGLVETQDTLTRIEEYRSSARELLQRVQLLEKKQTKEANDEMEDIHQMDSVEKLHRPSVTPVQPLFPVSVHPDATNKEGQPKQVDVHKEKVRYSPVAPAEPKVLGQEPVMAASRSSLCKCTRVASSSHLRPLEGDRELHAADSQLFKAPAPAMNSVPKKIKCADEKELLDREISKVGIPAVDENSASHTRCSACVVPFEEVTSRTFSFLQSSCHNSCDMHRVLQEATARFRTRHYSLMFRRGNRDSTTDQTDPQSERDLMAESQQRQEHWSDVCLTPIRKESGKASSPQPPLLWKKHKSFTLTPLKKGAKPETLVSFNKAGLGLTPVKKLHLPEERRENSRQLFNVRSARYSLRHRIKDEKSDCNHQLCPPSRRKRKDFSQEEVRYLLHGVKRYGYSWNLFCGHIPSSVDSSPGGNGSLQDSTRQPYVQEREPRQHHGSDRPTSERDLMAESQQRQEHWSDVCLTPIRKESGKASSPQPPLLWKKHKSFTLTPLKKGAKPETLVSFNKAGLGLTPVKKLHLPEERRENSRAPQPLDDELKDNGDLCCTRRKRKDFSQEEVRYLLHGVKRYGYSWNLILWSYPFQRGRTNVDLAKKYKQLMKDNPSLDYT